MNIITLSIKTKVIFFVLILVLQFISSGCTLNTCASNMYGNDAYNLSQNVTVENDNTILKLESYLNNPSSLKSISNNYNFLIDLSSNMYSVYDYDIEPLTTVTYQSWFTPSYSSMMSSFDITKHYYYGVQYETEKIVYPLDYRNNNWYFYAAGGWRSLENVHKALDRNKLQSGSIKIYKNSLYSLLIDNMSTVLSNILNDNINNNKNSTISIYGYNGNSVKIADNVTLSSESDITNILNSIMLYEPGGAQSMEELTKYVSTYTDEDDIIIPLSDYSNIENLCNTIDSYINPTVDPVVLKINFDKYYKEITTDGNLNIKISAQKYNSDNATFDEVTDDAQCQIKFDKNNDTIEISNFDYSDGTKLIVEIPITNREEQNVNNKSLPIIDSNSGIYSADGTLIKSFGEYLYEKYVEIVVTGITDSYSFLILGIIALLFVAFIVHLYVERD